MTDHKNPNEHMTGKCPKCEALLISVAYVPVNIELANDTVKGVGFACPHCQTMVTVGINPAELNNDIVEALTDEIENIRVELAQLKQEVSMLDIN